MKPTALVDCDGILSDFLGAALLALKAASGVLVLRETITTWEIFDSVEPGLQRYKQKTYDLLKARLGCSTIRPYEGSGKGMRALQEVAHVVIVTSPFHGSDTWMSERTAWLHRYFGIGHDDVIHAKKKHHIKGDIFVDDSPANVGDWAAAHHGALALLWDAPYNRKETPAGSQRVHGWEELVALASRVGKR